MERMRNISLVVEYEGTNYHGWQCQPNGITVEETLRAALEKILDHPVKMYSAGRTDAGVHAFGQVVNFYTEKGIDLTGIERGLNSMLPYDIRVRSAMERESSFHARYSARSKTYIYTIHNAPRHSPFSVRYSWHVPCVLDSSLMNGGIRMIVGRHDFASFKKKNEPYRSCEREVLKARVIRRGAYIYVVIEATGFLRYMVRNIVGTLVLLGRGKLTSDDFERILNARDRDEAGPTAPPQGLFLRRIKYHRTVSGSENEG
ncbi:MAG TPA: tRNA pseudouridine(38-40) synthase TruA [Deltaproteobacteria bacterium]|nr:tRNA pseudouridine(38-40) synthase TruA [Deltaproteobacteria bacterium]